MNRAECLQEAEKIVCNDREEIYGAPEDNFELISEFWTSYLSRKEHLTESDIAGYAALACEMGEDDRKCQM